MEKKNISVLVAWQYGFTKYWQHFGFFIAMSCALIGIAVGFVIGAFLFWSLIVMLLNDTSNIMLLVCLYTMFFCSAFAFIYAVIALMLAPSRIAFDIYDNGSSSFNRLWVSRKMVFSGLIGNCLYFAIFGIFLFSLRFFSLWMVAIFCGIVLMRFSLFEFLIIDKNVGPIQALKMSWRLSKGRVWLLFKTSFMFHSITKLPLVGYFLLYPGLLMCISVYRQLLAENENKDY